jgi:Domain of unknown function (DUF4158)
MFSRDQLRRAARLAEEDFVQLGKCRRPHNRLGFAYQVAFVRLFDRFPHQQPFELFEELVCFSAAQLGLDAELIERSNSTANVDLHLNRRHALLGIHDLSTGRHV